MESEVNSTTGAATADKQDFEMFSHIVPTDAQPTSGKQEQWTVVYTQGSGRTFLYHGKELLLDGLNRPVIEALHEHITASIASKRESYKLLEAHAKREYQQLREQLAAEKERSKELREDLEHYDEVITKREKQLASAQAAIRKLNSMRESQGFAGLAINDTTALDAAKRVSFQEGWEEGRRQGIELVAAARQPLQQKIQELEARLSKYES